MPETKIRIISAKGWGPIADKVSIDFEHGNVFVVSAGNARGKTTLTQKIFEYLGGIVDENALNKNATTGWFNIELSDGTKCQIILNRDPEAGNTFQIKLPDGKMMSQTAQKTWLKNLLGMQGTGFDIDSFLRETAPAARKKMIQELAGVSLDKYDADVKAARDARTVINRQVNEQAVRAANYDPTAELKPVDVTKLQAERQQMVDANLLKVKKENELSNLEARLQRCADDNVSIDHQIEELEAKLKALRVNRAANIESAKTITASIKAVRDEIDNMANNSSRMAEIDRQIADAQKVAEKISAHKQLEAEHLRLLGLQKQQADAETAVQNAEKARLTALEAIPLPAGLKLAVISDNGKDDVQLLYNGFDLEVASKAELTILGLKLKASKLGDLKYMAFDGSHLDHANLQKVVEWLEGNGFQACIEIAERRKDQQELTITVAEEYL